MSCVCRKLAAAAAGVCALRGLDLSCPSELLAGLDYELVEWDLVPAHLAFQYRLDHSRFYEWAPCIATLTVDRHTLSCQGLSQFLAAARSLRHLDLSCSAYMQAAQMDVHLQRSCSYLEELAECGNLPTMLPASLRKLTVNFGHGRESHGFCDAYIHRLVLLPCLQDLTIMYPDCLKGTTVLPTLQALTLEFAIGPDYHVPEGLSWFWEQPCKHKHLRVRVDTLEVLPGPPEYYSDGEEVGDPDHHADFFYGKSQWHFTSVTLVGTEQQLDLSSGLLQKWQALTCPGGLSKLFISDPC